MPRERQRHPQLMRRYCLCITSLPYNLFQGVPNLLEYAQRYSLPKTAVTFKGASRRAFIFTELVEKSQDTTLVAAESEPDPKGHLS
ncbi:hypothetical protein EGR_08389 [Echinococcus granulosus]|uniref:Uncharacterized protein n=1 Tax=Echinococcus granulosus TaxID=6210 RepID=W6U8K3_ECHGR|nr:hypothetical protein EGR_08389 [Echinococcus granulosus]EUB56746.1 hypothetical protein EGR_08389 [Echinococcus granulosus]